MSNQDDEDLDTKSVATISMNETTSMHDTTSIHTTDFLSTTTDNEGEWGTKSEVTSLVSAGEGDSEFAITLEFLRKFTIPMIPIKRLAVRSPRQPGNTD